MQDAFPMQRAVCQSTDTPPRGKTVTTTEKKIDITDEIDASANDSIRRCVILSQGDMSSPNIYIYFVKRHGYCDEPS